MFLRSGMRFLLVVLSTSLLSILLLPIKASAKVERHCDRYFCLVSVHKNRRVTFTATNPNKHLKLTVRLRLKSSNMRSSVRSPVNLVMEPGEKRVIAVLKARPNRRYKYQYWYHYVFGNSKARHDSNAQYFLPVKPGTNVRISQGCNGKFSHNGSRQFATDFIMPVGTPIHAARGGKVVSIREDSNRGGPTRSSFEFDANHVYIRHADGTLGVYLHLMKNGAKVDEGDIVEARQLIGWSGNTGWSTAPHLHFEVTTPGNNMKWHSKKIVYQTDIGPVSCPASRMLRSRR